ncbi:MAG: hypothetical protein JWQ03_3204 [Variovorax sp.]|nr:hypothetical protein [Variovorax sp.]
MALKVFFRKLVDRLTGKAARVRVAGFGKHPGWDDHAEICVDTPGLIETRRALYTEGIGANIESGAWERLAAEQRLAGFGHWFVWARADAVQVGRLWASKDGKGRSRYPMVVCADCEGVSAKRAIEVGMPLLEELQKQCQSEVAGPGVVAAIGTVEAKLREALGARAEAAGGEAGGGLVKCAALEGTKLPGILYQMVRNLAPEYSLDRSAALGRSFAEAPIHLRVPACFGSAKEALGAWIEFVRKVAGEKVMVLAMMADGQGFVDLILGPPAPEHLFGLLAGPEALPLTTEIPYNIPEEFVGRARVFLADV